MIKLWPSSSDQLTPRVAPDGRERNPFDIGASSSPVSPNPPRSPSTFAFQHPLLTAHARSPSYERNNPLARFDPAQLPGGGGGAASPSVSTSTSTTNNSSSADPNLTPLGFTLATAPTAGLNQFASAIPTTQLSLNAPDFKMQNPATSTSTLLRRPKPAGQPAPSVTSNGMNTSQTAAKDGANGQTSNGSRGQLHVKVLQARNLNIQMIPGLTPRPYVVAQFEQNEFISRDPIAETEREVKGVATALAANSTLPISRTSSSNALSALGAINSKAMAIEAANQRRKNGSKESSASSSPSSMSSSRSGSSTTTTATTTGGVFGRSSSNVYHPVWKHEVSLYVLIHFSLHTI